MEILVPIACLAILASLAAALIFMLRTNPNGAIDETVRAKRMARALAFRVGFSVLLFLLVLLAWSLGWIEPTGIAQGQ